MLFKKRAGSANKPVILSPVVVPPSNQFDGNDGSWSTFRINIGDDGTGSKGQNFRVLISTSSAVTLVPGQASWCVTPCPQNRGIEVFNSRQPSGLDTTSSYWNQKGLFDIPLGDLKALNLWPDANPNATFGTDNVGLGPASSSSPVLTGNWVVEYTTQDFFMGSFGMAALPVGTGVGTMYPFLANYQNQSGLPSTSYGYTAGAFYQNNSKGTVGSLVLGGYDQSRFTTQNTTVDFPNPGNQTLVVGVQGITYQPDPNKDTNHYAFTANTGGFTAVIDSTLPYLWLPDAICDQFVQRFQLTYDNTRNLYTVNETAHNNNVNTNSTLVFQIGSSVNSGDSISITLPYAAFDLEASFPIYTNTTRYFPIKKSPAGVFVLGRTFLQEAYLVVDYDREQFSIAPANWSSPMPESHIVQILPPNYVPPSSSTGAPSSTKSGSSGLSGGAIAGIVIGILLVFLLCALGAFFFWRRRRAEKRKLSEKTAPQEIDTTDAGNEVKHRRVSELDSENPGSPTPSKGGYYGADGKEKVPFPPINEMESPPAELYSPPPEGTPQSDRMSMDYFTGKMRRRGATRESSNNNTPGTPTVLHELPGDDGQYQVGGQHFDRVESPTQESPVHARGPSDTSLNTNIDEVLANSREPSQAPPDRRPSLHQRGPSDTPTESTAVSQPSPEELEHWATGHQAGPDRPLSPEQ